MKNTVSFEQTVAEFKAQSKYSLTLKEKNFIKKRLATLNCEMYSIKVSAVKNIFQVDVTIHDSNIVCKETTRRDRERYGQSASLCLNEEICKSIEDKIDAIVMPHQVCYSERDTMTDYFGSYRIDFYNVKFKIDPKVAEEMNSAMKQ